MKDKNNMGGYTIIEVLIVLVISTFMFVTAATFISGKQGANEFNKGVGQLASNIQNVYQQVIGGRYSDIYLTCDGTSGVPVTSGASSNNQGTNNDCVFLGKVIHFTQDVDTKYEVLTVIGLRQNTTTDQPIVTLTDANPRAVAPPMSPDLTDYQTTPETLNVQNVTYIALNDSSETNAHSFGFGFLQSQGTPEEHGAGLISGGQSVNMYYLPGLQKNKPQIDAVNDISASLQNDIARSVDICVTDGTYFADIQVGGASTGQLVVNVHNDGKSPCIDP